MGQSQLLRRRQRQKTRHQGDAVDQIGGGGAPRMVGDIGVEAARTSAGTSPRRSTPAAAPEQARHGWSISGSWSPIRRPPTPEQQIHRAEAGNLGVRDVVDFPMALTRGAPSRPEEMLRQNGTTTRRNENRPNRPGRQLLQEDQRGRRNGRRTRRSDRPPRGCSVRPAERRAAARQRHPKLGRKWLWEGQFPP